MQKLKDKGIKIELDKERYLKFNFNTLVDLEERFGSLIEMEKALANPSMKDIRFILYTTLKDDDDTLTERKVGDIINLDKLGYITEKLTEGLSDSLPVVDEDDEEKN